VHHGAFHDVRLVLFALFDGALMALQILEAGKALDGLDGEVAVRHGMTDGNRLPAETVKFGSDEARDGTLAAAGTHGANGNRGNIGAQLRVLGAEQPEVGAGSDGAGGQMHEGQIRNIAVRKDNSVNGFVADQTLHFLLFEDRNAFWIQRASQLRRIAPVGDIGNLSGGKGDDLNLGIVAKYNIEIVEVASCGSNDGDSLHSGCPQMVNRLCSTGGWVRGSEGRHRRK